MYGFHDPAPSGMPDELCAAKARVIAAGCRGDHLTLSAEHTHAISREFDELGELDHEGLELLGRDEHHLSTATQRLQTAAGRTYTPKDGISLNADDVHAIVKDWEALLRSVEEGQAALARQYQEAKAASA